MSDYIYDTTWEQERARLAGLEANLDPNTIRFLEAIGVDEGWRCLEVGGGGGSITAWLCERVGPKGSVVATDIDTRFLDAIDAPNLEVRTHDVVKEGFEPGAYDVVHSRDLLEHLPERLDVAAKLARAVAPGGWLLLEDVDFATPLLAAGFGMGEREAALYRPLVTGLQEMMAERGIDTEFGRHLPRVLKDLGLTEVHAEFSARSLAPADPGANMMRLSLAHLGPMLVERGAVTSENLEQLRASFEDPSATYYSPVHVSAWGRKPA